MKKRIDWIDIVRAMGMFLIIMGHTLEGYTYSIVGKLIFAVHVPVFFVLSGYLYKEKPVKKVFKSGNVNLLLPYLATLLIVVIITRFNFIFPNWIYKLDMHNFLISAFYGSGTNLNPFWDKSLTINAIGAIWFLLAMYFGNIIFNILRNLFNIAINWYFDWIEIIIFMNVTRSTFQTKHERSWILTE